MSRPLWSTTESSSVTSSAGRAAASSALRGYSQGSYGPVDSPGVSEPFGPDSGQTPGTYNLNMLDPANSLKQAGVETGDFFGGLRAALFGADKPDMLGNHGGILGGVPVLSDLARAGTAAVGGVGGAILGVGGNLIEGTAGLLEHLPGTQNISSEDLKAMFDQLPEDSEAKQRARQKIAEADGHIIGPATDYIYTQALRDAQNEDWYEPNTWAGLYSPSNTLMGDIDNLFLAGLGGLQRGAERLIAGADKPGTGGMNRLETIMAVGDGKAGFVDPFHNSTLVRILGGGDGGFDTTLNPVEQHVYDRVKSGEWTEEQGLDYLASHGAGLAHSTWLQVAGTVASDPLNVAALGGSALSAAAKAGSAARIAAEAGNDVTRAGRIMAKVMPELQGTSVGTVSKLARTIIDPFHALDLGQLGRSKMVDFTTELVTKTVVDTYGDINHLKVLTTLDRISPRARQAFERGMANYSADLARTVVGTRHRLHVLLAGEEAVTALKASGRLPTDVVEDIFAKPQVRGMLDEVANKAVEVAERTWDEAATANLARRAASTLGGVGEQEWLEVLRAMPDDMKSLLHAGTYGATTDRILGLRASLGATWDKASRLILVNRRTLTQLGADGIVQRLAAAGNDATELAREMAAAKELYPELRVFRREGASITEQAVEFAKFIERKKPHLPMQVTDDELRQFSDLGDFADELGDGWTLGFAPEDELKWGLVRTGDDGLYVPANSVFVDHVGAPPGALGYQAARHLTYNFRGQPITGIVRKGLKAVDYLEAGARAMKQGVTGTMIATAARQRFISRAVAKYGFTETEARAVIDALEEVSGNNRSLVNPRGMHPSDMWEAARASIPDSLRNESFDRRDLLSLVLDAYEGDIRFVGLTQKFTGRIKREFANLTGTNYLGQIAEYLYPAIKFRFNAVFQLQERIEPWVLNAQRGVTPALGSAIEDGADVATSRYWQNMVNHSLVRMSDIDQYEYSAHVLAARELASRVRRGDTALGRFMAAATDVQGSKQLNMLRTYRKGLGKDVRAAYDQLEPGLWDRMLAAETKKLGRMVSDDDLAYNILTDNMQFDELAKFAAGSPAQKAAFKAMVTEGNWHVPADLGELRPLHLNHLVELARFSDSNGKVITDIGGLRAALANGTMKMEQVTDYLGLMGANADYIARVESALNFHWEGFWSTVAERFNLTPSQSAALQDAIAEGAALRHMTPTEYVSQVMSPAVLGGEEARLGNMGALADMLVGGKTVKRPELAHLSAVLDPATGKYTSTRQDLMRQMGSIWAKHLDPSAKRALIMEFQPELRRAITEGALDWDLNELDRVFNSPEVQSALMDALNGHVLASAEDYRAANIPRTFEEYTAMYPDHAQEILVGADIHGQDGLYITIHRMGDGIVMGTDDAGRTLIIGEFGRLQDQYPGFPVQHVNIEGTEFTATGRASEETIAFAMGADAENAAIILNPKAFGSTAERTAYFDEMERINNRLSNVPQFMDENPLTGKPYARDRESYMGVPWNVYSTPESIIRHEFGHVLDNYLRYVLKETEYIDFMNSFRGSAANKMLSEYSMTGDGDMAAELWAVVNDPNFDPNDVRWTKFDANVRADRISDWRTIAEDTDWKYVHQELWDDLPLDERAALEFEGIGPWNPRRSDLTRLQNKLYTDIIPEYRPGNFRGPQSMGEAVEGLRDIMRRKGLWQEPVQATPNADLVRIYRHFERFTGRTVGQALDPETRNLARGLGLRNTEQAAPYSATEARLLQAVSESAVEKSKDAYKLQYFKQKRSMLERSINHPMFGLYPASYMWGKIAPEMLRFIAQEPFGVRTGAMGMSLFDVQKAIGIQREFDPEFDNLIEGLGHSDALWFLGYLLPAVPWDVGSAFPTWARDLAAQGNDLTQTIEGGGLAPSVNAYSAATKSLNVINPARPIEQVHRAAQDVQEFIQPDTRAEQLSEPVQGTDLGPSLEQAMADLTASLFSD